MSTRTGNDILNVPMDPDANDAGASSVGGYLRSLLNELWRTEEGFSGKRPFGNSGWKYELYEALALAEVIYGFIDPDTGEVSDPDCRAGDKAILIAIEALRPD